MERKPLSEENLSLEKKLLKENFIFNQNPLLKENSPLTEKLYLLKTSSKKQPLQKKILFSSK